MAVARLGRGPKACGTRCRMRSSPSHVDRQKNLNVKTPRQVHGGRRARGRALRRGPTRRAHNNIDGRGVGIEKSSQVKSSQVKLT